MASGLSNSHLNPKTTLFPNSTRRKMPPAISAVAQKSPSYWPTVESEIRTYLDKSIPLRPPVSVFEPMRHLTLAAPTTTAPSLCVAACELVGGCRSLSMAAAAAVHLIAAAAHIHQHLPLTDRPKPNPGPNGNHIYGPNIELLTGDGIVPFGLELLARSMDPARSNQDKVLRAIIEISRAGGAHGVVEGQYRELDAEECEENVMEYVCRKKEGELHGCGAACGAILGGGNEEEIEGLRRFGVYAGTIRGLRASTRNGPGIEENIRGLRDLAIKELEIFRGKELVEVVAGLC